MAKNYFNSLPFARQLNELASCRFMEASEFANGCEYAKGKKIVIVGCGAQGLNQGLNMRDSGLDVSYTLRDAAIKEKRESYKNATSNGFKVGTYKQLLPTADIVMNLAPDKQHSNVVETVVPMMKKGAVFSYATASTSSKRAPRSAKTSPLSWSPPSAPAPRCAPSTCVASVCRP